MKKEQKQQPMQIRQVKPDAPTPRRKRVAAYCRVSTGKDAMLHSLSRQISHYSAYIQRQPGWEYAGVYADEAYTGTKGDRPRFRQMLSDCRAGKIDLILTKSISRFARNTVTMLETVRELKALGIDVYFEEQNIHSMSGDGELMLTILASFAQEESKSVSDNCKWRIRKDFSEGKPMNLMLLYGYRSVDGQIVIDEDEAAVVRDVFKAYLDGAGSSRIAARLRETNTPRRLGGTWTGNHVVEMLTNEKYTGDALLQKTFVEDHLTKKQRRNTGQLDRFYAENTHPAIIDRETFERAQAILAQRRGDDQHTQADDGALPSDRQDRVRKLWRALQPQDALHGAQLHPALHMAVRDLFKQGKALLPREPDPGGDAHRPDLRGAGRGKSHGRSSGCAG